MIILFEPESLCAIMAVSRHITLVYEGCVVSSWSSKFQSISMREAQFHVPPCFEAGSYKIMISGKELVYVSMLNTNASDVALTIVPTSLRVNVRDVLRRDLLPFAVSTEQDTHLGHVKAIALLEDDKRFVLRLKTDIFVLDDTPTEAQVRAIKETLLELSPVAD